MFFVLSHEKGPEDYPLKYKLLAEFEVKILELILYIITTICVVATMIEMRALKYDRKISGIFMFFTICYE